MDFISGIFQRVGVSAFTHSFGWMHLRAEHFKVETEKIKLTICSYMHIKWGNC